MKVTRIQVFRYRLPFKAPVELAGEAHAARNGFLLALHNEHGAIGWGEAAPLPGFSRESLQETWNGLVRCARRLANQPPPETHAELEAAGLLEFLDARSVAFALETALLNLRAATEGRPLCAFLAERPAPAMRLNALLTGDDEGLLEKARGLAAAGYRAAKLKVGRASIARDAALVKAVRAALDPGITLRLDANQAWDYDAALDFAGRVSGCAIEYIEEPLQNAYKLMQFAKNTGVPYALDETLVRINRALDEGGDALEPLDEVLRGAAALVWKPSLVHYPNIGVAMQQRAAPRARLVLSGAYESGVGTAALANYAAAYSGGEVPVGLDTYARLADDVLEARLPLSTGRVPLAEVNARATRIDRDRLELVWES